MHRYVNCELLDDDFLDIIRDVMDKGFTYEFSMQLVYIILYKY